MEQVLVKTRHRAQDQGQMNLPLFKLLLSVAVRRRMHSQLKILDRNLRNRHRSRHSQTLLHPRRSLRPQNQQRNMCQPTTTQSRTWRRGRTILLRLTMGGGGMNRLSKSWNMTKPWLLHCLSLSVLCSCSQSASLIRCFITHRDAVLGMLYAFSMFFSH